MKRLDVSIGQRLAVGSLIVALLIGALGVIVGIAASRVAQLRDEKTSIIAPRARATEQLEKATFQQAIAFRNYMLTGKPEDLVAFRKSQREVARLADALHAMPHSPAGERLLASIVRASAAHERSFEVLLEMSRKGVDRETLRAQEATISTHRQRVLELLNEMTALKSRQNDAADAAIDRAMERLRRTIVIFTILILLVSVATSLLVARSVRLPAARLVRAADAMRDGSFAPALALEDDPAWRARTSGKGFRDELRETAHAFARMAATLKSREERLAAQSRLSAALSSSLDLKQLAADALREIAAHAGAEVGVIYLADDERDSLHPLASLALNGQLAQLSFGEGIPGQAAADRRTRIVRDVPADTPFRLRFGFDDVPPRTVVASPMCLSDRLIGVIVLGALHELDDHAVTFVEEAASQLAITLDNGRGHEQIARLVDRLSESNEELQVQNEELQAQGEELQAQSEELQSQNEELQAQSEELRTQTDELHAQSEELRAQSAALEQTNAALHKSEEQKNRFLAVLGHELRNPLAAIRGAVGLLDAEEGRDPGRDHVLEILRRQTTHLARLLDDLLDIGRITSGKIRLNRRPLDLSALVERVVRTMTHQASASGLDVRIEAEQPCWVEADETRIEQIVANLLTNALKYTPPDGTIAVRVSRDGSSAIVEVSDNGTGIDDKLLPHIFDFFVQGDSESAGGKPGLGVGLALVRSLVSLHGGDVSATSRGAGTGTTFTVTLPALVTAPVETVPAKAARLPISRSIVLVEDNGDVRHIMSILLSRAGHQVAEAVDGPSGVATVAEVKPDLALVDLDLPGFDGCEVARQLRSNPQLSGLHLIALSGHGRAEDRERALAAGFDEHLVKPLEFERLNAAILQLRGGDATAIPGEQ